VSPATLRAQLEQGSPPEGLAYRWGERSIRLRAADIPGVRGRLVGRSVQVEDETALAQQAALLDVILANSDEGILVTDPAGHILYHNVGFAEIWGIPSSLLARGVAHEIVAAAREQIRDPTHTPVNLDSALVRGEHTFTLRDGRIVETYSRPIPGPGPLLGRVWYTRDVSERRRTEQALFEAQKFESLGVMAGGIAHDFNNLLLCVLGNAALALDTLAEDAPVRALLEDVSAAAQRAGDLTRQLLAYAGRGHFEMEPLDLSPLVREVTDLLRATIPRHVKLEYDLAADLPGVMADPSQMRQIVMNLALNAADAIGDEPGSIRLTTRELKLEGAAVVALEVRDSGCGMDEETRRRIFDPFFTTKASGRGLGLAAVLGIVHAHQGQVWAETAPGEGSCFSVLLPSRGVRARPTAAPTPSAGWRSEGTVLVADDDPRVLRLTERILASAGFEVLLAGDGTAALELFRDRRHRIRAVVLDLAMPGVDGLEVWRVLRAEAPELPVVVSSGFPEEEALERLGGRFHFLQKPYPPGRLLERLRRALEGP
jgi:two-component system cell cycle sensor histidine kinase/response regulator CckA